MAAIDYLIIGGGIAGTTAAETLRNERKTASIAILEDEPHVLYSRVMIPAYLKNRIPRDRLFLRSVSDYESKHIDYFASTRVEKIDAARHEVISPGGRIFPYKKLLIASGGRPRALPNVFKDMTMNIPGGQYNTKNLIFRMHTMEDADLIKEMTEQARPGEKAEPKPALVLGESFIALEFLEVFSINGFEVHGVCRGDYFGDKKFGPRGGKILEDNFLRNKIVIHKRSELSYVKSDEYHLTNGDSLIPDAIGVGIGIDRNLDAFSAKGGSASGGKGIRVNRGIVTNEFLMTSEPDVYAAGDIAEFYDVISERHKTVGNWTNGFLQGRVAALNMTGSSSSIKPFRAVTTYNIVNFGLNLATIGDLDEADDYWEYEDKNAAQPSFLRVFLKGNKVKGAVMINRFRDFNAIARMIENGSTKDELEKTF